MDHQTIKNNIDNCIASSVSTINQSRSSLKTRDSALHTLRSCLAKLKLNTFIIKELSPSKRMSIIECLCDVYANKQRTQLDFDCLLMCLKVLPNDCSVMRGKIFQHLQVHANHANRNQAFNPLVTVIADCMARLYTLVKKGVSHNGKSLDTCSQEAWKEGMAAQLTTIERNVDLISSICNIASSKVIRRDESNNASGDFHNPKVSISNDNQSYDIKIMGYIRNIDFASHVICSLILIGVRFEKPIPITVILRVFERLSNIRWRSYPKKPHGQDKQLIYSHSVSFVRLHLMILHALFRACDSNLIRYTVSINSSVLGMLEWTRISLSKTLEKASLIDLRCAIYQFVEAMLGTLFLNVNLEQTQLEKLIFTEILQDSRPNFIDEYPIQDLNDKSSRCSAYESYANTALAKLTTKSLSCLNKLVVVYKGFLDPGLDIKIKRFAIVTCLDIYREFDDIQYPYDISHCRLELIKLLTSLANEPCSTSTSEIVDFILEQAIRFDPDSEIGFTCQASLKNSLTRPVLVSHHDAYTIFGRHMDLEQQLDQLEQIGETKGNDERGAHEREEDKDGEQEVLMEGEEQEKVEREAEEKEKQEAKGEREKVAEREPEDKGEEEAKKKVEEKAKEIENTKEDVIHLDDSDAEVEQMMQDFVDTENKSMENFFDSEQIMQDFVVDTVD